MKFGGSSLANAERIRRVAHIIEESRGARPIAVLSAMGDTTDALIAAAELALKGEVSIEPIERLHRETARELGADVEGLDELLEELSTLLTGISMLKELTARSSDYLVSFGERLSVRMMAAYMSSRDVPAKYCDAWDVGFVSDSNYTSADLLPETWSAVRRFFAGYCSGEGGNQPIPIVTGFIAKDSGGFITTLGRGGSDLTATVIGAALGADEVQTWKDVDGILTADPRVVPSAKTVPVATYNEAAELAYFGSQVLHPRSMQPCIQTGTPVRVKNSYNPEAAGTLIVTSHITAPAPVRAITSKKNVVLVDLVSTRMVGQYGFLAKVFDIFARHRVSIDVVATSEVSVSLTVDFKRVDFPLLRKELEEYAEVEIRSNMAIVTVICDARQSSAILAATFDVLAENGVNIQMISQGASKVNISMICGSSEADTVARLLHERYFGEGGLCSL